MVAASPSWGYALRVSRVPAGTLLSHAANGIRRALGHGGQDRAQGAGNLRGSRCALFEAHVLGR